MEKYTPVLKVGDIVVKKTTVDGTSSDVYWKLVKIGEFKTKDWNEKIAYTFRQCDSDGKKMYPKKIDVIRAKASDNEFQYSTEVRSLWEPITKKKIFK